jgi:hypothetical protein
VAPPDRGGVILQWRTWETLASIRVFRAGATARRRAAAVETELERLKRYLEVSQAALEAVEREMQTVRDQQVAMDS